MLQIFQSQICLLLVLWPWGMEPGPPAARQEIPAHWATPPEPDFSDACFLLVHNFRNLPPALAVMSIKLGLLLLSLLYVIGFELTELTESKHNVEQEERCRPPGLRLADFHTVTDWLLLVTCNTR